MTDHSISAYPLSWPPQWERNPKPGMSKFFTDYESARLHVYQELRRLKARDIIVSSNVELNRSGEPYSKINLNAIPDPAVAVYFTIDGDRRVIPCDRWNRVACNLQAIYLTIAALRGLERWGAKAVMSAAFQGFAVLPASTSTPDAGSWWVTLGVSASASDPEIERAFKQLAKQHHPDAGGSADAFLRLNEAYRMAKGRVSA